MFKYFMAKKIPPSNILCRLNLFVELEYCADILLHAVLIYVIIYYYARLDKQIIIFS